MKRLLQVPQRFLFLAALVQLLVVSVWWSGSLVARLAGAAPVLAAAEPQRAHALLMIYGFFPLFIFGFLIAAGPRWLDRTPEPASRHVVPALIAVAGAVLLLPALALDARAAAAAAALYGVGWLWMLVRFGALLLAARPGRRLHAAAASAALAAGLFGLGAGVAWLARGAPAAAKAMELAGLWGFLVPIFCVVCHRMIPFFASVVVEGFRPWRPPWVLAALAGGSVLHGALEALALPQLTWLVDAPLGLGALALGWRWGMARSAASPLLAMLHVGFGWLALAYALFAAGSIARLLGMGSLGLAPAHALSIGFLASLTMAMVSRVSAGLDGASDRLTLAAFALLQLAAITRVAADLWLHAYGPLLAAAALLWTAAFLAWSWRHLPTYWK